MVSCAGTCFSDGGVVQVKAPFDLHGIWAKIQGKPQCIHTRVSMLYFSISWKDTPKLGIFRGHLRRDCHKKVFSLILNFFFTRKNFHDFFFFSRNVTCCLITRTKFKMGYFFTVSFQITRQWTFLLAVVILVSCNFELHSTNISNNSGDDLSERFLKFRA